MVSHVQKKRVGDRFYFWRGSRERQVQLLTVATQSPGKWSEKLWILF